MLYRSIYVVVELRNFGSFSKNPYLFSFQFAQKMEQAQTKFGPGLAQDVESARSLLQQHQEIKKGKLGTLWSVLLQKHI